MVLGKLPVPGVQLIWTLVGQGPIALAVGADGVVWTFFSLVYHFSSFSPFSGRRPDLTEILSQRAVKPKASKQATNQRPG